jgi:hypothetical protein
MAGRFHVAVLAAALMLFGSAAARGDMLVRVHVTDSDHKADAPAMSVETLAGASGKFAAKSKLEKQTLELKGEVKKGDDKYYRLRVSFIKTGEAGVTEVTTNIVVQMNKPQEIGGFVGTAGQMSVVLTLEDSPEK